MNILYVGDVMGEMGMAVVGKILPQLRRDKSIDLVIAQAENVTDGKGITPDDFQRLRKIGVDFCTAGNWTLFRPEINPLLADPNTPIIRPANYPDGTPGLGYKYVDSPQGKVLIVSLLGQLVGRDADKPVDNPLVVIDQILESQKDVKRTACIVNFHGDYSSEKVVIGHYLDGRVSLVVGDHWHIPTTDARILPGGTAHVTDVGMCGALDSSLGVSYEVVVARWRHGQQLKNELETEGAKQFNAVLVSTDSSGLAHQIERIQQYL
jgi:metallophosphoesterase (TIGR00282 family)